MKNSPLFGAIPASCLFFLLLPLAHSSYDVGHDTHPGSNSAAVADVPRLAAVAEQRLESFFRILDLDEATWVSSAASRPSVGTVLGVGDTFIDGMIALNAGNMSLGWKGLRGVFSRPWVKRSGTNFVTNLFHGKVSCSRCSGHDAKHGVVVTKKNKLDAHEVDPDHAERFAAGAPAATVQLDLSEVGVDTAGLRSFQQNTARCLVIGKLVAGAGGKGDGASGIPPSSIPAMFDKDMLTVRLCWHTQMATRTSISLRYPCRRSPC